MLFKEEREGGKKLVSERERERERKREKGEVKKTRRRNAMN